MKPPMLVLALVVLAACNNRVETSCVTIVPSTLLHEIYCGEEAPQGICFAEVNNGF